MEKDVNKIKGLSSLSQRISKIEQQKDIEDDDDDALSTLVSELKKKENEKKKIKMIEILSHYTEDLSKEIQISNDNIIEILIFTIKYFPLPVR